MRRTLTDIKSLEDLHTKEAPLNFRLCKGIYVEAEKIAYKKYQEVNDHYLEDLEYMMSKGMYPGIATTISLWWKWPINSSTNTSFQIAL